MLWSGWFLPDGETHLQAWMTTVNDVRDGRLRYQGAKYDAAVARCRQRRVAVDVGAHVGLFSHWLAQDFAQVQAFEPHPAHRACWLRNVEAGNAALHPFALGARAGVAALVTGPSSSGDTRITRPAEPACVDDIDVRTLDSFNFDVVDFLKIDCEGYELEVLRGAVETLRRCRPTVMVEQKPGHGARYGFPDTAAVSFLEQLGAVCAWSQSGDFVLTFPEVP
jgi:FkbM family methyltransferase